MKMEKGNMISIKKKKGKRKNKRKEKYWTTTGNLKNNIKSLVGTLGIWNTFLLIFSSTYFFLL